MRRVERPWGRLIAWSPVGASLPGELEAACVAARLRVLREADPRAVVTAARQRRPEAIVVLDADRDDARVAASDLVRALKRDGFTALIPTLVIAHLPDAAYWLELGADDVLPSAEPSLGAVRLQAALRRHARDVNAQPTTGLPGVRAIDAEITRRIDAPAPFAACYADLDHFKEYNDRYGFHEGDRVIRMVARVLQDAAAGVGGDDAFVGHIGGDDFMLVVALERARATCELAIEVFDTLVPLQYTDADRRAGYYFGKDRRGQLHRVPLMSLSIGAATTERRQFRSAAEVSRLASEMKSFAKARPGSVYAVDRRGDGDGQSAGTAVSVS